NARGIQLSGGQLDISSVTVSGNWDGMVLTGQPGSTVQWNTAINNIYGIYLAAGSGTLVAHNQIVSTVGDGNTRAGIVIDTSTGNNIKFNDIYLTNPTNNGYRYGIYLLNTSSGATVTNNNLAVDALGNGSGYRVGLYFGDTPSRTGFYSNYNNIYGANYIGWYPGANWSTLLDWIANTGLDVGSLSANPLWANVNALDFHLQSTAGRWNPSTQAWVTDASDSPALDAADPTEDFSQEPSNNGNRANIGSYGNTPEASKSQTALNVGRVRIDPTGELFNGLGPALVNLATVKSPFTQDYT